MTCNFVSREEKEGRFERAAAVAVFLGHIGRAITCLQDGAKSSLKAKDSINGRKILIML